MSNKLTRKQFLKLLTLSGTATGVTALAAFHKSLARVIAQLLDNKNYLPLVLGGQVRTPTSTATRTNTPTSTATATSTATPTKTASPTNTPHPGNPMVVHVHNPNATNWTYSSDWYGDYVDQTRVNTMMNEGLKTLTGKPNISEAWSSLLPGYVHGNGIAIKVNFNNTAGCDGNDNRIDALMEPVNALIAGMLSSGVQATDIWIYDAIRPIPSRFSSKCLYPSVQFIDRGDCEQPSTFDSGDQNAEVIFQHPSLNPRRVTDVIINASYLINMPIIKDHGTAGVTLGFKNHFGTINYIMANGENNLHYYIDPIDGHYQSSYNPLVDIYSNPHILDKTILTVGDGLFGAFGCCTNTNPPSPWVSFGNKAANSFFLSTDPVAVDCVMLDILDAEGDINIHPKRPFADDYLKLASGVNMGVYERGDPWGAGYQNINYIKLELS